MQSIDHANLAGATRAMPVCARAIVMAESIRMLVNRDGHVTEQSLICEGFTAAEIVEHFTDAEREARRLLTRDGRAFDRVPEIIEKAIAAQAWVMPLTAATPDGEPLRAAWRDYCTAMAAHKLDPWISQRERCLARLHDFLGRLSLIESEVNRVINGVAAAMRVRAA